MSVCDPPVVQGGDLHVRIWFGIVKSLLVNLLLGMAYINKCSRCVFSMKSKIVPEHSALVSILGKVTEASVTAFLLR